MRVCAVIALLAVGCSPATPEVRPQPVPQPTQRGAKAPDEIAVSLFESAKDSSCAVRSDGSVWCWGDVFDGLSRRPLRVKELPPAIDVTVTDHHACAITRTGELWCWGELDLHGDTGGLFGVERRHEGMGPLLEVSSATTFLVTGPTSCALTAAGTVRCWNARLPPADVPGLAEVTSLDVGKEHACALSRGVAWCWFHGMAPNPIAQNTGGVALRTLSVGDGGHCGLAEDGRVLCWGAPCSGATYSTAQAEQPCRVELTGAPVKRVDYGFMHLCVVQETGTRCWRRWRLWKKGKRQAAPVFETPEVFADVTAGADHACGLTEGGEVRCWKAERMGERVWVPPLKRYRVPLDGAVTLGWGMACWLGDEGARCFSTSGYPRVGVDTRLTGEILNGTQGARRAWPSRRRPVMCWTFDGMPRCSKSKVLGSWADDATALAVGPPSCAVTKAGALHCEDMPGWTGGEVTDETGAPLRDVVSVDSDRDHGCAVAGGRVVCWGSGAGAGHGDKAPRTLAAIDGATQVVVTQNASCALVKGDVLCWGDGRDGELGDGRFEHRLRPEPVVGLPPVTALDGGRHHVCALDHDRQLWCWGDNSWGQLGIPGRRSTGKPTRVDGVAGVGGFAAASAGTCVVLAEDSLCWGNSAKHTLDLQRSKPKPVAEPWSIGPFAASTPPDFETVDVVPTSGRR